MEKITILYNAVREMSLRWYLCKDLKYMYISTCTIALTLFFHSISHTLTDAHMYIWVICFVFFFKFYFIFKLYNIVLVLPNIEMNLPQVYPCSPSWTLLPPPSSLPIPSLWVVPVHQPQSSSIMHRTWTGDLFHTWYYTC